MVDSWPKNDGPSANLRQAKVPLTVIKASRPDRAQIERNGQIFNERLTAWRKWLADLQDKLCSELVALALANRLTFGRDPLDWVNECVENFWATRRPGFKNWVILGCDWADTEGWSAPGWLLGQMPDETLKLHIQAYPLAETLEGRVLEPSTEAILSWIAALVEWHLDRTKTRVLDEARIALASESGSARSAESGLPVAKLNEAIQGVARKYGEEWDREFLGSTRGLYAELHPTETQLAEKDSSPLAIQINNQACSAPTEKLPAKKTDLSGYFDEANLTDAQREAASLRWECGLRVTEIARRLGKHRKSIEGRLDAAKRKIAEAKARNQSAKKLAKEKPGALE
jgi:predicted DNA-binding protein (UPF0251 family)